MITNETKKVIVHYSQYQCNTIYIIKQVRKKEHRQKLQKNRQSKQVQNIPCFIKVCIHQIQKCPCLRLICCPPAQCFFSIKNALTSEQLQFEQNSSSFIQKCINVQPTVFQLAMLPLPSILNYL